ncbi:MAG TPA: hypothetical protein ENK31_10630 [Nannocystis exedens]|nr:hypothetical protein [Nannocystis exedens]
MSASEGTSEGTTTGTTTGTTDATGMTDTATTTEGTTGGELCKTEENVSFQFQLLPELLDQQDFEVDYLCEVVWVGPVEDSIALEMSCTDGDEVVLPNPVLMVHAEPATELWGFSPGMQIRLIYGELHPWWTERWVRIELLGNGDLMLAGVSGSALSPNNQTEVFAPFEVTSKGGICAPFDSECGELERLSVAFLLGGGMEGGWWLTDDTFDIIDGDPGMSTWVDHAQRFVGDILCTDTSEMWFSIGMIADGQE